MKQFIQKLSNKNLFLKEKNGELILNGKKGKLTKGEILAIKNDHTIIDFIKKNKTELIDYLKAEEKLVAQNNKSKNITAIYGLSPMQEGMLFHELYDSDSIAYTNQMVMGFPDGLNLEAFKKSCNYVLKNHSILRTAFFHEDLSVPIQSVFKKVEMPITMVDFSDLSKNEQEKALKKAIAEDQHTSFDFTIPPLMRATLFKISDDEYQMVWTHHHIIIDGWSMPIIMSELLEAYDIYCVGKEPIEREEDQYKDYIDYIASKDEKEETSYWENYMETLQEGSLLPFVEKNIARNKGVGEFQSEKLFFDEDFTNEIRAFCQQHHLTANTLVQGVWSYLLARYTGKKEIVFGVTVSGRPSDYENTEERVGLYINTLPLHAKLQWQQSILDFLKELQNEQTTAREYQYSSLSSIKRWSGIQGEFFDSLLVYESYPVGDLTEKESASTMKAGTMDVEEKTNYLLTLEVGLARTLGINMDFNASLLEASHVCMIKEHFRIALTDFVNNSEKSISKANYLTSEEENVLLNDLNQTATDYPKDKNAVLLFEENAAKTPDAIAVRFEEESLSYKELNERANQFAHYLQANSIQKDDQVVFYMNRGIEYLVSMLGVWKVGGCFIPLSTDFPLERNQQILSQSNSGFVITTNDLQESISGLTEENNILYVNASADSTHGKENINISLSGDTLSYIIFTSGSTGTPKGAMVEHQGMLNHFYAKINDFDINNNSNIAQTATQVFDVSIWQYMVALMVGGTTTVLVGDDAWDPKRLFTNVEHHGITVLESVPAHFSILLDYLEAETEKPNLSSLEMLMMNGEGLPPAYCQRWFNLYPRIAMSNVYGPTECSDDITHYIFKEVSENWEGYVPIGKPIQNMNMYIVDEDMQLLPKGIIGELCTSGDGVGQGYLGREDLTQNIFIDNPFTPGAKLYKTGDLVKWLEDGNIEFIGRKDSQVKISGNRIELGEIEVVLQEAPQVVQGAVLVKEEENIGKRLVGYIEVNESYTKESLKDYLEARLPIHMIPSIFVEMEEMPLTPSGKIDRKALPDTDISGLLEENYIAPRNELEKGLVTLWQNLLNIPKIGIDDNFFELGGDSIITIQLVSRAKREGYSFTPKDVFEYQTIRKLSDNLEKESKHTIITEQEILEGEFDMLPIQRLFFEDEYPEKTHYNQSLLLNIEKTVSQYNLETIVKALIERHDTFRLAFEKAENAWKQRYTTKVGLLQYEDVSEVTTEELSNKITEICENYQSSLRLETAEVVKFVFIQTPESDTKNRLFIVAHHLTIDGVSWRIILDDINESLQQITNNKPIQLGKKGSSYRQFSEALSNYAKGNQIASQQYYWETIATNFTPLPVDHESESSVISDIENYRISLNKEATQALLKEVHKTYTTEMNDILLSALVGSITNHFSVDKITIGVEGHGREDIFENLDISGTVGWFTNVYPLVLSTSKVNSVADLIKSTKEQVREVPEKGIGYGILRYMSDDATLQKSLANITWDIEFNYLGQLDNALTSNDWLSAANEHPGENLHKNTPHKIRLEVNSFIADGELQLSFGYSKKDYNSETIETIANAYITTLKTIIEHCVSGNEIIKTPSDYELQGKVSYQELDAFFAGAGNSANEITSVYELSPMQEGMLFHGLYDDSSISYTNQVIMGFPKGLDLEIFKKSSNHVLKHYSILRSGFFYENMSTPIQAVFQKVEMPIEIIDYTKLSETETEKAVAKFIEEDQKTNFDFNQPPLMRITLLNLHDGSYKMIWTHHHIILDGWSMPILMNELLETYESFIQGIIPVDKKEDNYQDYIKYIQSKNKKEEEAHWTKYLSDLEEGTLLPFINNGEDRNKGIGDFQSDYLSFDASFTTQLKNYCKANHITANTLMQGAWAYLLGQYTSKEKVVYGVTVSGRPSDFENTEQRIGLYINTIPLHTTINNKQSIAEFLTDIQKGHIASREYQYSALNDVKKWSNIQDEFFDSLFVFENYPVDEVLDQERSMETTSMNVEEKTNYPITIEAVLANTLNFKIDYNASILATKDIKRIKSHIETLLKSFISGVEYVGELNYLTETEHTELLDVFNTTAVEYPQEETIVSLFESQVAKTPNAIAAVYEDQKLTYKELDEKSNQLGQYLREKGVKDETFVPICVERSLDMIVGMLAIVKSGGVYVPIDPNYPQERVDFILNDLNAEIVVTENALAEFFSETIHTVELDTLSETLENYSTDKTENTVKSNQLLYIIYTSGTTGTPKGVLITHENVVRLLYNEKTLFDFNEKDVWSMFHSYNFDFSVWEMYGALLFGGKLVVVPKSYTKDPELFGSLLANEGVTILNQTPSSFSVLQERVLQNKLDLQVRYVIFGGEALHPQIVKDWKATYGNCKMINMYGITETTVHVTYKEITEKEIESNQSNIGVPIPTLGCVILDDSQKLVPTGVQGELYVTGAGLARGYLNREELTKERFVTLTIGNNTKRYYRSGDLAKINTEGELEYLGRKDDQVKIRGYRIELGEIDSVLNKSELIKKGVTLAQKDTSGIARLLSYIIPADNYSKAEVQEYLRATLPSYMVPAILVELDEFPITSNGKIDKKNLLERETVANSTVAFVAPRNEMEENLAAMWKKVLKIHKISIHDNFFEIGGNSIDIIKLVSEIQKEYEIDISLRVLFDINTIADLAKYIKLAQPETEDNQNSKVYDL